MKKKYLSPEVEVALLEVDDILKKSLENEVEINGDGLFDL